MDAIRVVLADKHPVVRFGIRALLEQASDFLIVGEASDGAEALNLVMALAPDVLVLEIQLPRISGLELVQRLHATKSNVHILAFSASDDERAISRLLKCGVSGYLTKDEGVEHLVDAIRGAARGENGWFSRRAAVRIMHLQISGVDMERLATLSYRERQVLRLLARGYDNPRIAAALAIAEGTVKNHVTSVYAHLDVRTRVEAAAWAWEHGLMSQDSSSE